MKRKRKNTVSKKLSDCQLCSIVRSKSEVKYALIISPAEVVTAGWVPLKCQFGCDEFGLCLVCPPFTPTPEQMRKVLDDYDRAILIHFSQDADTKAIVADLEREIFLAGFWKVFGLGAGPCYFCKQCPVNTRQCRHADRARPSMEACGIDVFSTVKKFNLPIEVVRNTRQCPNYYGLILVD